MDTLLTQVRRRRFGQKYSNINFYESVSLWHFNAVYEQSAEPTQPA